MSAVTVSSALSRPQVPERSIDNRALWLAIVVLAAVTAGPGRGNPPPNHDTNTPPGGSTEIGEPQVISMRWAVSVRVHGSLSCNGLRYVMSVEKDDWFVQVCAFHVAG